MATSADMRDGVTHADNNRLNNMAGIPFTGPVSLCAVDPEPAQ
jgi:hypothetical protein